MEKGLDENKLNPAALSKLFDVALGRCHEDYIQVLLSQRLQPDPHEYDKNYMLAKYEIITEPACENIYKKMGWNKGCEYNDKVDSCQDFVDFEKKYYEMFQNFSGHKNLQCKTDSDCLKSLNSPCQDPFTASTLGREKDKEILNQWQCPFNKRLNRCCRQTQPQFFTCGLGKRTIASCVNFNCQNLTIDPATGLPEVPPIVIPSQLAFFKNEKECQESYKSNQSVGISIYDSNKQSDFDSGCMDQAFQKLPEILHVQVVKVQELKDKKFRIQVNSRGLRAHTYKKYQAISGHLINQIIIFQSMKLNV